MPYGILDPEDWRRAQFAQTNQHYGPGGLLPSYLPQTPTPYKPVYNPVGTKPDDDDDDTLPGTKVPGIGGDKDSNGGYHDDSGDYHAGVAGMDAPDEGMPYLDQTSYGSFGDFAQANFPGMYDAYQGLKGWEKLQYRANEGDPWQQTWRREGTGLPTIPPWLRHAGTGFSLAGIPGAIVGGAYGLLSQPKPPAAPTPSAVAEDDGGAEEEIDPRDTRNIDRMGRGEAAPDPFGMEDAPRVGSDYIRDAADRYGLGDGMGAGGGPLSLSPEFSPRPVPPIIPSPENGWGRQPLSLDFIGQEQLPPSGVPNGAQLSAGTDGRNFLLDVARSITSPQSVAGFAGGLLGATAGGMPGAIVGGHLGANAAPGTWRELFGIPLDPSWPVPKVEQEQQFIANDQEHDDWLRDQEAQGWVYDEDNDVWYRD